MANSALIEDLRKQFAENPRRVFARLANEYRKSGDLDVAIEICRAHVPLQPTYISGYIVLGQALFERGQPEEARSTFETALSLDPENLIALRQLGDIARATGDPDAARGWYHKLLEVDPQNEEAASQLEALDAPTQSAAVSSGAVPSTSTPTPAEPSPVSWSDIHPDSEVTPLTAQAMQPTRPRFTIGVIPENLAVEKEPEREAPAPAAAAKVEAPAPEPLLDQHSVSSVLPEYVGGFDRHSPTPPAASPVVPEPVVEQALEIEGNAPPMIDIAELAPADGAVPEVEQGESDAEQSEEPEESELQPLRTTSEQHAVAPATAAELEALFAGPELEMPSHVASVTSAEDPSAEASDDHGPTFDEEPYDPTVGRMLELSGRTSTDALLPDLMMTESGAELLREQGHVDQAIYVYRHLAAKNPGDTSYAERNAALERGAHSSIPLIADISQDVISAAKNRPYSTQSIRTFFTSFATRRPPEGISEESPTHESSAAPVAAAEALEAPALETTAPDATASTEAPAAHSWHTPEAAEAPAASMEPWSAASLEHTTSFAVPPEAMPAPVAAEPPSTVSDADRSALETLFSGSAKTVAPSDERAANSLASAFSEEFSTELPAGPAGQPTRAASDALSLDSVFQSSRTRAEGEQRANQPTVSFDQFFNSRENGNSGDGKSAAAVETASLTDDSQSDLELFHEWLDGLKK